MKLILALLAGAFGLVPLALYFDSALLVLLSVGLLGLASAWLLAIGARAGRRGGVAVPRLALLAAALAGAGVAVAAVVIGERADAPGLMLWGVALIVAVVLGVWALGVDVTRRGAQGG